MTATDEILALAASAAGPAPATGTATDPGGVTEADFAAFGAAAARGAGSAVVRALLAVRPGAGEDRAGEDSGGENSGGENRAGAWAPPGAPTGDPAWQAWLAAAAALAGADDAARADEGPGAGGPAYPAWCAVFAVAAALGPEGPPAPAAVAAGLRAAAVVESGLADWGGWSSGTVAAAIGASVTAGLLLRLPPPRLRAALGIAATQAAGLAAAEATPAFALQAGKAAFNGVEAALLARAGFTAPDDPLDGRRGLFALFGSPAAGLPRPTRPRTSRPAPRPGSWPVPQPRLAAAGIARGRTKQKLVGI